MADQTDRASVNCIKRVDPYVKKILFTATQVAVYKFNLTQNEWEKTEILGALFLYSRSGEPYHSFMILNRLNKDNYIEPIVSGFDYQLQLPFLLYRNYKCKIFGIWFFYSEECNQFVNHLNELTAMDREGGEDGLSRLNRHPNGGNVDIFSMLSKAQEDFKNTPSKQEHNPPAFSSTPRVSDQASKRVMDFFAKASSNNSQKTPGSSENVLHRLMSNPAHSVEHIEKQQRSVTPQEQASFRTDPGGKEKSVPINIPLLSGSRNLDNFDVNGRNISSMSPTKQALTSSPLNYLMYSQSGSVQAEEGAEALGSSPFAQFLESAQKPLLMTPMMFTTPTTPKERPPEVKREPTIEMLTERQLAQSLIYLLKNNRDFIKQIHQAYTNSILEKVDKPKDGSM